MTHLPRAGRESRAIRQPPLRALQFLPPSQDATGDPAMAAGVTDRLWEIGDIVKVLEDWEALR